MIQQSDVGVHWFLVNLFSGGTENEEKNQSFGSYIGIDYWYHWNEYCGICMRKWKLCTI